MPHTPCAAVDTPCVYRNKHPRVHTHTQSRWNWIKRRGSHKESSTSDSSGSLSSGTKPRRLLPDKGNRPAHPPHREFWGRIPAPWRSPALDLKSECCAQLCFRLHCYQDLGSSGENQDGDWGEEAGRKVPTLFFSPHCFPEAMNFGVLSWGGA